MIHTTPTKRARIVSLFSEGTPAPKIASMLDVHRSTVYRVNKKYSGRKNFYSPERRKGRPRKLDDHDVQFAVRKIYGCAANNGSDLQRQYFQSASARTVRRYLYKAGMKGRKRRRLPLISRVNRKLRWEWSMTFSGMPAEFWHAVIFSDESKINLFDTDGEDWCRRRDGDALDPRFTAKTVKHGGGSLMVWGCISSRGVGRLYRIEGTMTGAVYTQILQDQLLPSLTQLGYTPESCIFQQDNDPKHTSELAYQWFVKNDLLPLPWIAQSPDMNPIEHVWGHLKRCIRKRAARPQNLTELWNAVEEEWYGMDVGYIRRLYNSMPRRITELRRLRGWNTKY